MHVLLTGASGFVGNQILLELRSRGHRVRATSRSSRESGGDDWVEWAKADFGANTAPETWSELVDGVDAVVNAVGIIRETRHSKFQALHSDAPRALFQCAADAGLRRLVQVSASGVTSESPYEYFTSKSETDEFLSGRGIGTILRPSLIFGERGEATQMFRRLASLPVVPLIGDGSFLFRPVQVSDVARLVVDALDKEVPPVGIWEVGGEDVLSLKQILLALRAAGKRAAPDSPSWGKGPTFSTPLPLMRLAAWQGKVTGWGPMDSDMLGMLVSNEAPDIEPLVKEFGWSPIGLIRYLKAEVEMALSERESRS